MDIGAHLREAREARGLSTATVAATTRIKPRILEAIERNDVAALPPGPYARGFVAAYAREIGLDPQDAVRRYFAQFESNAPAPAPPAADPVPDGDAGRTLWIPAVAVLAVLIAAGVLASRAGGPVQAPEPMPVGTSGRVGTPAAAAPDLARASLSRDPDTPASPSHGEVSSPLVVTLETTGPAWVAARTDGRRALYQILPAGTTRTLRADREVSLRIGDAGLVRLSVNGRAYGVAGARGEVRSLVLTSDAVR
jgi:cytoskeleton protein RodZ